MLVHKVIEPAQKREKGCYDPTSMYDHWHKRRDWRDLRRALVTDTQAAEY
jgi:hypothetical protein